MEMNNQFQTPATLASGKRPPVFTG